MRILVDMNLSPRWVSTLVEAGISAIHWAEVGAPDAPDTVLMDHARDHHMVVLTHDLDFSAILAATGGRRPSVAQIRAADVRPAVIGQTVIGALLQLQQELQDGALVTIDPKRTRVRILPLRP